MEKENLEEEWNQIPEPLLKSMLNVHNQLFGSGSLYEYVSFYSTLGRQIHIFHLIKQSTMDGLFLINFYRYSSSRFLFTIFYVV